MSTFVEQLRPSVLPMFTGVLPFSEHFTVSDFTSIVMAFLYSHALPSEESLLFLGGRIKGTKLQKKQQTMQHK